MGVEIETRVCICDWHCSFVEVNPERRRENILESNLLENNFCAAITDRLRLEICSSGGPVQSSGCLRQRQFWWQ